MLNLLLIIGAYFIGAVPSAYLFGRLFKRLDVRSVGSGNVGAMNTFRHIGRVPGLLTLAADVAKGALAVYLASRFGSMVGLPVIAAVLVILGHNYNIFLRFQGGKGLASLIGALLILSPLTVITVFGCIALLALVIRDTNTATGLGILTLPLMLWLQTNQNLYIYAGLVMALLIIAKYRPDFRAYREGRRKLL